MNIYINGEAADIKENLSLAELLAQLQLQDKRLAVEINCEIVPRSMFGETRLQAEDKVEIVQAIGGG